MNVAAFGPVGPQAPSWRVRVLLPSGRLREAGIDIEPVPLFGEAQATRFQSGGPLRRARVIAAARRELSRRLATLGGAADTVLVQRHIDMAPPLTLERRATDGRRVVLDVDDAVWLNAPQEAGSHALAFLKAAGRKVRFLAERADAVIAGNEFLAEWLAGHNSNVVVVPSLVDPSSVPVREHADRETVTWGWIGSRSTARHLEDAIERLERAAAELRGRTVRLLVLGAPRRIEAHGLEVEQRAWSETAERRALGEIDIGLMPLPDNAWTRGKCAYKGLLYMSAGIPVVADDVGVSAATVGNAEGGLIATTRGEWTEALNGLSLDVTERSRLGQGARARAEEQFSVERWAPVLASTIRGSG